MSAKIVKLKYRIAPTGCSVEKMPLAECRQIWNDEQNNYSDEELILIRDFLHQLAEINHLCFLSKKQKEQETQIIEINKSLKDEKESNSLSPGKYRRAS